MPETTQQTRRAHKPRTRRASAGGGLDEGFYAELLHIVGLRESVSGVRRTVARLAPHERLRGALIELALSRLAAREGESKSEWPEADHFELALRLSIAWISRLVFLKVLETRLLTLHGGDSTYAFLNAQNIGSFSDFDALCDAVLGAGDDTPPARFAHLPRFDGSLFRPQDLDRSLLGMSALDDRATLPPFRATLLPDASGERHTLAYLLDFLAAFDFSAGLVARAPTVVNRRCLDASALGLVFEKLNGYRDGAWYTPGSVAMQLARPAITHAAINRLNRAKGWRCTNVDQLSELIGESIETRDEARAILDSLRICDPAVGSGHLLVSALNELLALKVRLGLLSARDREALSACRIDVTADRLCVTHANGEPLSRERDGTTICMIEAALFRVKRDIVEHSLFGVDIHADSVGMARLRLWIELLEHADFTVSLPNLETNLKAGNATLSRFDFHTPLRDYAELVANYRASAARLRATATPATRRAEIARFAQLRDALLNAFANNQAETPPEDATAFEWRIEFADLLTDEGDFERFDAVIANPPYIDSERMINQGQRALRERLARRWPSARGNWDLYIVFMELGLALLRPGGAMAYLTPDKWLSKPFGNALRARHLGKIERIVGLGRDVFEQARVDSIITVFHESGTPAIATARIDGETLTELAQTDKRTLETPWPLDALLSPHAAFVQRFTGAHPTLGSLLPSENACATSDAYRLAPLVEVAEGGFRPDHHYRVVNTGTLGRYVSRWGSKPMTYLGRRYEAPVVERERFASTFANGYGAKARAKKVIVKGLTRLDAALDLAGDTIPAKTTLILRSDDENLLKFAAALLNCPLSVFLIRAKYGASSYNGGVAFTRAMIDALPVPGSALVRSEIANCVTRLLRAEQSGCDSPEVDDIAREIDRHLYQAFGLSPQEIDLVEGRAGSIAREAS
ncbi:BREX-1 system adenine-specific DNA-methyltransferase PglX [Paraburkholderia sp. CNPSo 3274]|uniref:type IIG restriction enzyme/methyltransferase n=1 Tax=Paraburkholderia sp. CNPSo 3274 TaxID=2940932 RepID=UPI0020B7599A|nr:Eco57I restriction-modification methylase domain-containing protein [Paraburkholderia sp. CNPSo 3274]MCP3708197.1 BREX-1 system adenine-specific DNA-methyltransferase PglX [Paraburkholderia sp. CNPSo 3274]